MADLTNTRKYKPIPPEEIDHYVRQAHRMRAEMVRTMAIGLASQIRMAIQKYKTRAGKAGDELFSSDPGKRLTTKESH